MSQSISEVKTSKRKPGRPPRSLDGALPGSARSKEYRIREKLKQADLMDQLRMVVSVLSRIIVVTSEHGILNTKVEALLKANPEVAQYIKASFGKELSTLANKKKVETTVTILARGAEQLDLEDFIASMK